MTPKFTPGPWRPTTGSLVRVMQGGTCIAGIHRIGSQSGEVTPGEVEANAHLIAAAPDMYAALRAITEWLLDTETLESGGFWNEPFVKANNLALVAVAKAEGREPAALPVQPVTEG